MEFTQVLLNSCSITLIIALLNLTRHPADTLSTVMVKVLATIGTPPYF